jgi:branched-subunit amino acid ABC-type transport system permease component
MLLQQLVNGLTLGAIYTLLALSFSIVMGILGILNLAIAELFMIGGYFGFTLIAANFPFRSPCSAAWRGRQWSPFSSKRSATSRCAVPRW